jgi:dienelactone hydrolase
MISRCLRAGVSGLTGAVLVLAVVSSHGAADARASVGSDSLALYFRTETERLEAACRAELSARLEDWQGRVREYRRRLFVMLGLEPRPPRGDLRAVVTGRIEQPEFTVERLHFQSVPGLYVTANFYLPQERSAPVPGILYVCGHAPVKTNGVSCGNKTAYQHHGVWFARNGYACLVMDTVQLGEIEGLHHGTYREGMWWWNARGYTPAGVEAWNAIRALDYLESRPEVDRTRLGMTGRSGGGSYTWTVAALDERVRVAAPVAGITDLRNQVVDGCVEGHCDCMFFVNRFRWDFPQVAALVAPRALLIVNTDEDPIFPLDGVVRLHAQVRQVYAAYGEPARLGLVIGPGGHNDTQDLQVPVLRWFNRHLKGNDPLITSAAEKVFDPLALRVFAELPADQINTRIHEVWGQAPAPEAPLPTASKLRQAAFSGWPESCEAPLPRLVSETREAGMVTRLFEFTSQPHVILPLIVMEPLAGAGAETDCRVLNETDWRRWEGVLNRRAPQLAKADSAPTPEDGVSEEVFGKLLASARENHRRLAWLVPRGVGPCGWTADERKWVQIRRRFMLLGQTLDGMRVWDIRQGVRALRDLVDDRQFRVALKAGGGMAVNALYASLFEPAVSALDLEALPKSHREGPDYLNVLQLLDLPGALALARRHGITVNAAIAEP